MKIIELSAIDQMMHIFLKKLNTRLIEEGYEVICVSSKGVHTEDLKKEGFNMVNVNIDRKIRPLSNLKSIFNLYKLFRRESPDIVHVHTPIASVLARIAAKLAKVPITIYTAHGFYFHENMSLLTYKLFLNIEKYMARYFTDFIFTQSQEDRITALNHKFIKEDRILAIGNGVDIQGKFNPANIKSEEVEELYRELNIAKDDKVVTFTGRLVKEKGIVELLEAFSSIENIKVKLLVVGDSAQGSRDTTTKDLIMTRYRDRGNIVFTGFRNDINNILYITDIFCLPSHREGMPRSIIEAMAMECGVIATNIRGSREEVVNGVTGFLINVNAPREIKERVITLLDNDSLLKSMKVKGRERALKLYDENKIVKKQIDVIERLFRKHKL